MKHLCVFNKNKLFKIIVLSSIGNVLFAQNPVESDSIKAQIIDEVIISSIRANNNTPVTFSNISKEELKSRNLGQDIPSLLNYLPSVVTTSDAGNGIGYSGIRVRGSDATRVNVTINGIPYNDSESHGTFWVNMPDLASSVENIQLQRGVGTSTNGAGAFGASLNILTDVLQEKPNVQLSSSIGSYQTFRNNLKFSTGKIGDNFEVSGRISKIKSDGYVDRAWVDLNSYFLQAAYKDDNRLIKGIFIGGNQKTYQAWNGLEDQDKLENDRTYNTAGEMYDSQGNFKGFYKNETDNYKQNQYQLHWSENLSSNWKSNLAFFYTQGKGYYENYKNGEDLSDYGLSNPNSEEVNLVRQKWLDNQFYGSIFSATYKNQNWNIILGGAYNVYQGDHFGDIIWISDNSVTTNPFQYYFDTAKKTDFNFYSKANYQISERINAFVDLQFRNVDYKLNGQETGNVHDTFIFFNPKLGFTYNLNENNNLYFSFARSNREPNRDDYENGNPKPEKLNDYELGWRLSDQNIKLNVNGYYMRYQDQLVLTGALNDVGAPVRENSGDSYRLGLEVDATIFADKWIFRPTIALSQNKNIDFKTHRDGEIKNLGNTNIAFSPDFIMSNAISYSVIKNGSITLLNKYVSSQYMSNLDLKSSKLDSYFITDFNASYSIHPKKHITEISFSLLVNNIFNQKYISNGYFYSYDDSWSNPNQVTTIDGAGYYPQATRNFLLGITLSI